MTMMKINEITNEKNLPEEKLEEENLEEEQRTVLILVLLLGTALFSSIVILLFIGVFLFRQCLKNQNELESTNRIELIDL